MIEQKSLFLALPDELLLWIADFLEARHVHRLIRTCQYLEGKLTPYLYRQFHERGRAIRWAGKFGHRRTAQSFLEHMPDNHPIDKTGYNALVKACKYGHTEIVRMLLDVNVNDAAPGTEVKWKKQPLTRAINEHHNSIVNLLLEASERLPLPEPHTFDMVVTLLDMGNHHDDTTVAQMLIAKGLRLDVKGPNNMSVLHRMAAQSRESTVQLLFRQGVDINVRTNNGSSGLYYAALGGNPRIVQMFLDAGADLGGNADNTSHPLTAAISAGNLRIVKQLVGHGVPAQFLIGPRRHTPLHVASYHGAVAIGMYLVENGASCQAKDSNGKSPLDHAMVGGKEAAVRLLVAAGYADTAANVDELLVWAAHLNDYSLICHALRKGASPIGFRDQQGQTALHLALQPLHEPSVTRLLNAGAPINTIDHRGQTPLMHATAQAAVPLITRMLSRGDAEPNQVDVFRRTVVHHAILGNNVAVVPELLRWAPEFPDIDGLTPLLQAIVKRNHPLVQLLLQQGARPNVRDRNGASSLYWAVTSGQEAMVSDLLQALQGYPARVLTGGDYSPIHRASRMGDIKLVQMLVAAGASSNTFNHLHFTPLMYAARQGDLLMTQFWIHQGANLEVRDDAGQTALFLAIRGSHPDVVQLLLAWGAQVNILNRHGYTPLHCACLQADIGIVSQLRRAKANGHLHGEHVRKPILMAAQFGAQAAVQLLAEQGGWDGTDTADGRSALSLAAEGGHVPVVRFFLSQRLVTDIDATDREGRTVLSWAVQGGSAAVVQMVVKAGADVTKADQEGHTPLWWALHTGHEGLMRYLTMSSATVEAMEVDVPEAVVELGGEPMELDSESDGMAAIE